MNVSRVGIGLTGAPRAEVGAQKRKATGEATGGAAKKARGEVSEAASREAREKSQSDAHKKSELNERLKMWSEEKPEELKLRQRINRQIVVEGGKA